MTTLRDMLDDYTIEVLAISTPPEGIEYPLMDKKELLDQAKDTFLERVKERLIG